MIALTNLSNIINTFKTLKINQQKLYMFVKIN